MPPSRPADICDTASTMPIRMAYRRTATSAIAIGDVRFTSKPVKLIGFALAFRRRRTIQPEASVGFWQVP